MKKIKIVFTNYDFTKIVLGENQKRFHQKVYNIVNSNYLSTGTIHTMYKLNNGKLSLDKIESDNEQYILFYNFKAV